MNFLHFFPNRTKILFSLISNFFLTFAPNKFAMKVSSTYRPQNLLLPQGYLAATTSYTFSSKERDSETLLSYFGARYYTSDLSIWLSVDPMSDKYPSLSPYTYCADNPIKLVDPNGEDIVMNDDLVIRGANNSSVTIKTDLVNLDVSVASLGIDFGGNYSLSGNELLSAALDLAGFVDPTGIADGANAVLQAKDGKWGGAFISAISVIGGDPLKLVRIKKDVNIIKDAIKFKEVKSLNQLNKAVQTGHAPKGIVRFDKGQGTKNLPYDEVHFEDGSSLYKNGTWRHLGPNKKEYHTNKEQRKF